MERKSTMVRSPSKFIIAILVLMAFVAVTFYFARTFVVNVVTGGPIGGSAVILLSGSCKTNLNGTCTIYPRINSFSSLAWYPNSPTFANFSMGLNSYPPTNILVSVFNATGNLVYSGTVYAGSVPVANQSGTIKSSVVAFNQKGSILNMSVGVKAVQQNGAPYPNLTVNVYKGAHCTGTTC